MARIAFIGLGSMGEPMAGNLLKAGFQVTVVGNRRPDPVDRLVALGARSAPTPAQAAAGADIVFTVLPTSDQVEGAVLGADGLLAAMAPGSVLVDCTTARPDSTRKLAAALAERGVGMVDAGLTRGIAGAKQAKLAYFVGGSAADLAKVKPALDAMGDTVFHMGAVGTGHETKILSNALSYGTVALVAEVLKQGKDCGLNLPALQAALMTGAASKALEAFGPRIIAGETAPVRVSVRNVRHHLDVAETMAPGALALLPVTHAIYDRVAALGLEDADMAAIAQLWDRG